MTGIYKITNPNGKIYIGQSNCIEKRWAFYKRIDCKNQKLIYRSLKKYGVNNHSFEIIDKCPIEKLNERERYWQEYYDVLGRNGLNMCLVSTKDKKYTHSEEALMKISKTHKGKQLTEYHINKITESRKGKTLSKEHIKKLVEGRLKTGVTNKQRESVSKSNSTRIIKDSTRKKMSQSRKGIIFSDEHKKKISDSLKGRKRKKETVEKYSSKRRKIILDFNTGVFYFGAKEAGEALGIKTSTVYYFLSVDSNSFKYV